MITFKRALLCSLYIELLLLMRCSQGSLTLRSIHDALKERAFTAKFNSRCVQKSSLESNLWGWRSPVSTSGCGTPFLASTRLRRSSRRSTSCWTRSATGRATRRNSFRFRNCWFDGEMYSSIQVNWSRWIEADAITMRLALRGHHLAWLGSG